jgi:fibronectin type 3 domain-containing protein
MTTTHGQETYTIGSPLVFLGWDAVADRRVAGYRVYRAQDGGAWQPVGGSFAPGYVDLTAGVGAAYRYAVAAYTAEGGESPLSLEVRVGERSLRVFLPLVARGEI